MKVNLFLIFFCSIAFIINGQTTRINFNLNSVILDKTACKQLDTLAAYIIKDEVDKFHIYLINFPCESELRKNRYIGAMRMIEIVNYLQEKYSIKREKFYYSDSHPNRINNESCEKTIKGIEVKLVL